MTGQNDRQDRSLTSQVHDQAGHRPLTGRYLQPCTPELSDKVIEGSFFAFEIFHSEIYLVGKFGEYFLGTVRACQQRRSAL